ncbi:30S ribosomal protein S15 [Candidatus Woesearchaeota archaeon]|nr:30S ribosomal protein S15 [Candidatus Woesearchaeota archaeon]|tara:strand:- start:1143 stop:1595 length:453 start_codon:yes stop_codon:yes gene_type:complete
MARMHSRDKGRSGSKRPLEPRKATWLSYSAKEIEMVIAKLAKEDKGASEIGLILRDKYGVPDTRALLKKRISKVLADKKLSPEIPEELSALIKKAAVIEKHLEHNKQDQATKRGLQLTRSKIARLSKYYKKKGTVAESWKYDTEKSQLLV